MNRNLLRSSIVCELILATSVGAQSINNGSFSDLHGTFSPGTASQIAPGWTPVLFTPDWDVSPGSFSTGTTPPSPDGGHWMSFQGFDSFGSLAVGESLSQTITGLTPLQNYRINFYQINIPRNDEGGSDDGFFDVGFFGTSKQSPTLTGNSNTWASASVEFTATGTSSDLLFMGRDANLGNANPPGRPDFAGKSYMGLDGVSIEAIPTRILGTLRNFDMVNRTGQFVNDFHMTLYGITPDQIGTTIWTVNYPNATVSAVPGGTRISWDGHSTPPNFIDHFGYRLAGTPSSMPAPTRIEMEWTIDGVPVPNRPPGTTSKWVPLPNGDVRNLVTLQSETYDGDVFLARRVMSMPGGAVLDDLLVDGDLWANATLIDDFPLLLPPDTPFEFDFALPEIDSEGTSIVMMYDLFAEPVDLGLPREELLGSLLATYLDAAILAPSVPSADFNGDDNVDAADANALFQNWNQSYPDIFPPSLDTNGDGIIDAADASSVFALWSGDSGAHSVPEPSWAAWYALSMYVCALRRRTR